MGFDLCMGGLLGGAGGCVELGMGGRSRDFPDGLPKNIRTLKQDARRYSARFPVMDSLDLPRLILPAQKLSNLRRPAKLVDDVL